jgi:hypothetical protein
MPQADISELIGKTFTSIEGMESGSDDGYIFFHQQNCCERVSVYEVIGDPADLVGSPILRAEERSSDEDPAGYQVPAYRESYTWTFYEFATIKGSVTVRWLGESNGCYSEGVTLSLIVDGSYSRW